MADVLALMVRRSCGITLTVEGQDAWTLHHLIEAGERGVTPVDQPAQRWSHYMFRLRALGIDIKKLREPNSGPYAGQHGRYVLREALEVVALQRSSAARQSAA